MNKVILIGRNTKQAELKVVGNDTHITQFTIAVDDGKDKEGNKASSFFNCKAFSETAKFLSVLNKGALLGIVGRLHQDTYTDKEGVKKSNIEIIVEKVDVLDWNEKASSEETKSSYKPDEIDIPSQDLPF